MTDNTLQSDPSRADSDRESRAVWYDPRNWPALVWVLCAIALVLLLPFAIRTAMLAGVPIIAEPFDVQEFCSWDVPADQDAFTDYHLAVRMHQEILTNAKSYPSLLNSDDVIEKGWSVANESVKKWLDLHYEALAVWKRGTEKQLGRCQAPDRLESDLTLISIHEMRLYALMATLEQVRCLHEGRLDDALNWARATNRCGAHVSYRGCFVQGLVGTAVHATAMKGVARWAERPEVTSEQLKSALADLNADYQMYERPSNLLRAEFLVLRNSLRSRDWWRYIDLPSFIDTSSPAMVAGIKMLYWMIGEPELALRLNRHILANQIPEIDKPLTERRALTGSGMAMLFDEDPAVPRVRDQLNTAEIDRAIKRSSVMRSGLSALAEIDQAFRRRFVRQVLIGIVLASQAYRRDHGEFPETLNALVPAYLDAVPVDPFSSTGASLLYRRDEAGKGIVWSIGADGIDDGGMIDVNHGPPPDTGMRLK